MQCINIEIQIDNKKISFEIESKDLYQLNCFNFIIKQLDKIIDICVLKKMIILRTEDRDFRNGALQVPFKKDDRRVNNIYAYNWMGQCLWNIGEIVGDLKTAFHGCMLTTRQDLIDTGILKGTIQCSDDLLQCYVGGFQYIIDPFAKTVLSIITGVSETVQ